MSENRDKIIANVQGHWQPFRDLVQRLGTTLEEKTPAGWTAKEMLGTIAFWDEAAFGWITLGLRQKELPAGWAFGSGYREDDTWPGADVHNARESAWAGSRTLDEVLTRCDRAHAQLLEILSSVTDDEAERHKDYFSQLGGHYADHMPELEALRLGVRPA